jgi:uncharacterized protein (DUF3820 family)
MRRKGKRIHHLQQQRSGTINSTLTNRKPQDAFRELDGVMRYGKYKGKKIQDIPKSYIEWMLENLDLPHGKKQRLRELI